MIWAILGGLGAAGAWTASTLCSSRSSRMIDPASVVGWVMISGLLLAGPIALADGVPQSLHGPALVWLAVAGTGNVLGLLLAYVGLRSGQVALVAPIVSTEGAMAALIAVVAGETLATSAAATLAVIGVGIAMASVPGRVGDQPGRREPGRDEPGGDEPGGEEPGDDEPGGDEPGREHQAPRAHAHAVVPAILAAVSFGASLYAAGRAGALVSSAWVAVAARAVGVPVLALPLALGGRLRLSRRAAPLVVVSGVCEVLGFYAYTGGARHAIAVAAVISSQFGSFAAVAGFLLFGERLTRVQCLGVMAAAAGVAALALLQA